MIKHIQFLGELII